MNKAIRYSCLMVLAALLLGSCAAKRPFTDKVRAEYKMTDEVLKKIQFYTSEDIILYRRRGRRKERLCTLRTVSSNLTPRQSIPELPSNPIKLANIHHAQTLRFTFDWSGAIAPLDKPGHPSFWAINKTPWPGIANGKLPAPLARLKLGQSYIFVLENTNQYHHPIHLHGVVFTVLSSNKKQIIPYQADTVMLGKYETVRIAFVADNPGRWMFHCHLIEHMKTGLMGYFEIS